MAESGHFPALTRWLSHQSHLEELACIPLDDKRYPNCATVSFLIYRILKKFILVFSLKYDRRKKSQHSEGRLSLGVVQNSSERGLIYQIVNRKSHVKSPALFLALDK